MCADGRPSHQPDCPARDPDISPELLQVIGTAVGIVIVCTCRKPGDEP